MNDDTLDIDLSQASATDAEILAVLSERIDTMLEKEPDMLMSLLYRLDIEEKAILHALEPTTDVSAAMALAKIVLDRQKQRSATKKAISVRPLENPEEWNL
jgi:hypothetical protein